MSYTYRRTCPLIIDAILTHGPLTLGHISELLDTKRQTIGVNLHELEALRIMRIIGFDDRAGLGLRGSVWGLHPRVRR